MHYDPKVVAAFVRVAKELTEEVAMLDINKYGNNTHLPQASPESVEEQKLMLRKKGFTEIASTHREIYALHEIFKRLARVSTSMTHFALSAANCNRLCPSPAAWST
ncbi:MAG: hypothetical protein U0V70_09585 [Terriglobia bacterium]